MESKKHYYWIDLLRFSAALLVVLAHYRGNFFVEYGLLPSSQKNLLTQILFFLTRLGEEPVLVFFVLSGFLVGGKAIQRILNNDVDIQSYFIDRSVRIFLPLFASSVLVILIDLIIGVPIPFKDIIGSIFSLQGILTKPTHNVPLWSLSYEVWFYILIGCIMAICRNKGESLVLPFFIFAISIFVFVTLKTMYLLILLMGTMAFLLPRQNIKFLKKKVLILLGLLVLSFLLLQVTSASKSFTISYLGFINRDLASVFLAFIASLLIHYLIVLQPKSRIGMKINGISTKLSDFSYTLYLTHYPLMSLLSYWGFPKSSELNLLSISLYLIAVLISLLSAYLIYLVSEKQTYLVKRFVKERFINN